METDFTVTDRGNRLYAKLLDAVTATGTATELLNVDAFNSGVFHIISTGVTTGADIEIQNSIDGVNWATMNDSTKSISGNGVVEYAYTSLKYKYIRANITSYTDGTYTVLMFAGA